MTICYSNTAKKLNILRSVYVFVLLDSRHRTVKFQRVTLNELQYLLMIYLLITFNDIIFQDAMLREYQNEIQKLKQLLEQGGGTFGDFGKKRIHFSTYFNIFKSGKERKYCLL